MIEVMLKMAYKQTKIKQSIKASVLDKTIRKSTADKSRDKTALNYCCLILIMLKQQL